MFKKDFPIFENNKNLVFLDTAASSQKPKKVIEDMKKYLETSYANIHRGAYDLSMDSSLLYDKTKQKVAEFLGAQSHSEIVFTYNATYAINFIARSLVKSKILNTGDTILLSKADHHANIVPWQIIADEYDIKLDWVELHEDGTINYDSLEEKLPGKKLLALTGASNVSGEISDVTRVKKMIDTLEEKPLFLLDGSQRFPHLFTDVVASGIDFFVGTGHKVMSDTGIGFFYGRKDLLRAIDPALCGGGAINKVSVEGYLPAGLPFRHEPGTPHIAGAVSLLSALEYIESIGGYEVIEKYEDELVAYTFEKCKNLPEGAKLIGGDENTPRMGVFAFTFANHHPHDVAEYLADQNICVRSGHHCAEPLHNTLDIGASLRMSLYIYNTKEDIDAFFEAIDTFFKTF
ncbi:aminotransferase class V-fold PLP-dependent enzyme [Candidatus Gracilibacteria bacterium]|nr:aminotransferase class V-fold PLP-dependent enzyme [Candidatus Gracilibacteria bacterium]